MVKNLIQSSTENNILILTINRPDALNALNKDVIQQLGNQISKIKPGIKGVIITGSGDRSFAAGADISEFQELNAEGAFSVSRRGQQLFDQIENLHVPVVAVVNGFALGGGCELAMACHLRIAEDHARFGQPEVNLGLIPGYGGTQRLPLLIGQAKALELMMTGDMISAMEAHRLGLVNEVVPSGDGLSRARELLAKITTKGPLAIASIISLVNNGGNRAKGLKKEAKMFARLFETEDAKEGVAAFLEKRKPKFRGK